MQAEALILEQSFCSPGFLFGSSLTVGAPEPLHLRETLMQHRLECGVSGHGRCEARPDVSTLGIGSVS